MACTAARSVIEIGQMTCQHRIKLCNSGSGSVGPARASLLPQVPTIAPVGMGSHDHNTVFIWAVVDLDLFNTFVDNTRRMLDFCKLSSHQNTRS